MNMASKFNELPEPIVDCSIHYVNVMKQMTRSKPTQAYAIGARLTEGLPKNIFNYGQL